MEVAGRRIRVFSRHEFLTQRWNYKPGQHVLFIAPSQDGKTTLAFQLLQHTATPKLPAYVMVMKPRDPTPAAWTRELGYLEVPDWPPPPRRWWRGEQPPAGYTVWPPHTKNVRTDNRRMQEVFTRLLAHGYNTGDCVMFADEVYGLIAELPSPEDREEPDIEEQIIAISTRGSGMGCGLWAATQKPSGTQGKGLPGFLFSNASKLFLSRDPDRRAVQRYAEIGGVDPDLIRALVGTLDRHQFVFIDKGDGAGGPYVSVIAAK